MKSGRYSFLPRAAAEVKSTLFLSRPDLSKMGIIEKNYFEAIDTERRFLPFALRRFMTRRPFFVAIRTRKP